LLEPIWLSKRETSNRVRGRIETIIAKNVDINDEGFRNPAEFAKQLRENPSRGGPVAGGAMRIPQLKRLWASRCPSHCSIALAARLRLVRWVGETIKMRIMDIVALGAALGRCEWRAAALSGAQVGT
jgi:hypothetical protein